MGDWVQGYPEIFTATHFNMAPASGVESKKEKKEDKESKGKDESKKEEEPELVDII